MSNQGTPKMLRVAAHQLEEDAQDCWGIRRQLNLRAAAMHMRVAATRLEAGTPIRRIKRKALDFFKGRE